MNCLLYTEFGCVPYEASAMCSVAVAPLGMFSHGLRCMRSVFSLTDSTRYICLAPPGESTTLL